MKKSDLYFLISHIYLATSIISSALGIFTSWFTSLILAILFLIGYVKVEEVEE